MTIKIWQNKTAILNIVHAHIIIVFYHLQYLVWRKYHSMTQYIYTGLLITVGQQTISGQNCNLPPVWKISRIIRLSCARPQNHETWKSTNCASFRIVKWNGRFLLLSRSLLDLAAVPAAVRRATLDHHRQRSERYLLTLWKSGYGKTIKDLGLPLG